MSVEPVGSLDDINPGTARVVEVGGQSIALCRVEDGDLYAIENRCTHDDGPLGEGELDGDRIECPRHGALFDVATGRAVTLPAIGKVRCFAVSVDGGQVQIEVD